VMGQSEVFAEMQSLTARRAALLQRVVTAARPVIAVLKDSGRMASAAPLDELFFELDALDAELMQFASRNIDAVLDSLKTVRDFRGPDV
jgi:hypothetical protein